ncbi:hypothetical protein Tco_1137209 [Tanacetum coccineum]
MHDTLVDICFRSGISTGKKVDIGLGRGRDKPLRPTDMLLYSWDKGRDHRLRRLTEMIDFVPRLAVIEVAQRKRIKYEAKCADIGYGSLPFSFSSSEELERDGVTLLKQIRKTQDIGAPDMLLYSWDGRLDVCVDLTGSSPLTPTGMVDFVPGRAVIDVGQRKCGKYIAKCAAIGYGLLPFSFSSLGELEADAVTLLKRIRKFSMVQDIGARAAVHIFNRISFVIAKGVAAQIVSRLPSLCAAIGYGFLPFSFSSLGELETDVVTLLKRIRKFSITQDVEMTLWKSQMEDHTSDWLRTVPISGFGQTMNGKTYRCVLCYRLGIPLFSILKPCSKVFADDIYGDHVVSCTCIIGIKHLHNIVRDTLVDICYRSGISAGLDVCVDLTESSPLTQTGMADFISDRVVIDVAQLKRVRLLDMDFSHFLSLPLGN